MRRFLTNYLNNYLLYWQTKLFVDQKITFRLFSNFHLIRNRWQEEKTSSNILRYTIGDTIKSVLYAALILVFVEWLNTNIPVEAIEWVNANIKLTFSHDIQDSIGLLITSIVAVNGVFLGLYYTTLSSVAGSIFIKAPEELQSLFLRDRMSKQYIDTVVTTTVLGILYLLMRTLGTDPSNLSLLILTILGSYSIIQFLYLAQRAFHFIRPVEAGNTVSAEVIANIDNVSASSNGFRKNFLQDHYRKQALRGLQTIQKLITFNITIVEKVNKQDFISLAQNIGFLLNYYLGKKKSIPTESLWFTRKYEQQKWLLADSSELIVALNTGTSLTPKTTKNSTWFEEECLKIIFNIFDFFIKDKDWESAYACTEVVVWVVENTSHNLYLDFSELTLELVQKSLDKLSKIEVPDEEEEKTAYLAIADSFGRIGIGFAVSLIRNLDKKTPDFVANEVSNIDWKKSSSIYKTNLPGQLTVDLENTSQALNIESAVEHGVISPEWYLITITLQRYLFHLEKYYRFVEKISDVLYKNNIKKLKNGKHFLLAAQLCERWQEFTHKNAHLSDSVATFIQKSNELKKVKDLPWTSIEADQELLKANQRLEEANDELITLLPVILPLSKESASKLPDYFGKIFIFGVSEVYKASLDNNHARLQKIYPMVFIGALTAYQDILKSTEGWALESKLIYASEPLEDLLVISGFIKIYSELFENQELWKVCQKAWDTYLSQPESKVFLEQLQATTNYRETRSGIMPRDILRTNWDISLRQKLQEKGLNIDIFDYRHDSESLPVNHNSALIRVLSRQPDMLRANAKEIFFATYLTKHPAAASLTFPDNWEIGELVDKEEKRVQTEES